MNWVHCLRSSIGPIACRAAGCDCRNFVESSEALARMVVELLGISDGSRNLVFGVLTRVSRRGSLAIGLGTIGDGQPVRHPRPGSPGRRDEDENLGGAGSLARDKPIPVFFDTLEHRVRHPETGSCLKCLRGGPRPAETGVPQGASGEAGEWATIESPARSEAREGRASRREKPRRARPADRGETQTARGRMRRGEETPEAIDGPSKGGIVEIARGDAPPRGGGDPRRGKRGRGEPHECSRLKQTGQVGGGGTRRGAEEARGRNETRVRQARGWWLPPAGVALKGRETSGKRNPVRVRLRLGLRVETAIAAGPERGRSPRGIHSRLDQPGRGLG